MAIVNPKLAVFAARLNEAWEKLCDDTEVDFFDLFGPVEIKLYTVDGFTAKFWEDGIEFYPAEEEA